ncbi:endopeptidase La [Ponticoccus sp. SC2-23]|uniref:endopeptidase La n=1 Tax=Alexandriicola marinus TaxID=2081710 RepID=UPI000FD7532A|nr:endopeptidase La [Alexandriicola marinus]MBM1219325.1 endopeptidase La [Ponticoccus sp. SC6-9]MBM1223603.1 endopeptidase La [Ponticoccus sp. SC6-15]MBM1229138.1 endopeptidase La [Ponticoccus sp. SC6-38]MBM1232569.1 endopeptidase La [Ponticoccus sp. SC6-45]MBM1237481.1 endopeptidase La [Ponticoccus sp. SC6-49]MBM1241580.1 endopeptidase La [Ponticoccus sp. SC2-64]MBM1246093.1 endopeptidase La [Ponticoccus sp. SC6-42]MBM1250571.1 endopeptidase La [Ponticoccus sp. SC6-33]MBM1255490.1 endope
MENPMSASYPVLPLRDIVVFPHMIVPLFVGREKSVRALEEVMADDKQILLSSQIDPGEDDPGSDGIYKAGVLANVLQLLKLPDGTVKVLVEGKARVQITEFIENENFFEARAELLDEELGDPQVVEALVRSVAQEFERYSKVRKNIPEEALAAVTEATEPAKLADLVAGHLGVEVDQKQELLETLSIAERLEKVYGQMQGEMSVLQVEKKIKTRVKTQMERTQREYYLNEQMKAIQKELGDGEDGANELAELEEKIAETKLSKEAREKAEAELKKLKNMSPMSAEATVVRNYLDWMLAIPWGTKSRVKKDLSRAEAILDADHYGLDKVKERIVEYLAVQQRSKKLKGPIMCLVGPPGVGKTSLGKSVAKATGREFIRISLGGVRDESEIRGHRRTYIGSMPGKIIQALKKAKTTNPLILLDEIDKMGQDFRGDPASAMLEVLDPEQNNTFVDHYLEVEYDLSNVMFLTTANSYNMPGPLLDRMEIIPLAGYTEDEKREIAKQHLLPKVMKNHGLREKEFVLTDEAISEMIRTYTREAGVRNLEREIAKVARKAVTKIVKREAEKIEVTAENINDYLGVKKYRFGLAEKEDQIGVVTGLAYTSVGGELLSIEALRLPGKGRMKTTGKLGDVMKESIDAASSYVRSIAPKIGVKPPKFDKMDIHVHVPDGATPKDGPSAGLAMVTSIVSVLTQIPVRKDIAMTGEVSLRGNAMPIGGLKEKLLAALRGGITTVLIPEENEKDLSEIPDNVKEGLKIIPVSHVSEVLEHALVRRPEPIEWDEAAEEAAALAASKSDDSGAAATAH